MTINERFEFIIQTLFGGNKRAFAIHVGVSPTVVENVVGARKGKPSFDFLVKVCANANISAEWLLMGTGEMAMDMFEVRKTPMVFHQNPERYIEEGKKEITNESESLRTLSDSESATNRRSEANEILLRLLKEKDNEIGALRENIGKLKARIEELEREKSVPITPQYARSTSKETVET